MPVEIIFYPRSNIQGRCSGKKFLLVIRHVGGKREALRLCLLSGICERKSPEDNEHTAELRVDEVHLAVVE